MGESRMVGFKQAAKWTLLLIRATFNRLVMKVQCRLLTVRPSKMGHDNVIIQDRIDYLAKKKGHKIIELDSGTYDIRSTINLTTNNITLIMGTKNESILRYKPSTKK